MEKKLKYFTDKEIQNLIDSEERLVYVYTRDENYIITYKDIPDFIVDYNYKFGQTDLALYDYWEYNQLNLEIEKQGYVVIEPFLTTFGFFLNRCNPEVRKDIIGRLVYLQQGGKINDYKVTTTEAIELITKKEILKI